VLSLTALWAMLSAAALYANSDPPTLQPAGWDLDLKLAEARDLNPDPRVVEVSLDAVVADVEIAPGHIVKAWTYNGGLPGPLIRVRAGDRLVVHFTNRLPAPTTVHWHGMRVPIEMDGVPEHSQPEVEPGEAFTYDFVASDAGLFWYHPHVLSASQVGFGLYGALLVEDPDDQVGVAAELVLVLSDIAIDEDGSIEAPDSGGSAGMVFGREGNRVLVNGRELPRLKARSGAPQRWRVVNASKSRYFELYMDGLTFTKIGNDGGIQEYPEQMDRLLLATGERADVIVAPRSSSSGGELVVSSLLHNRGYGSVEFRAPPDLFTIEFADLPAFAGTVPAGVKRAIAPTATAGATEVRVDLTLAQKSDGTFEYGIDGKPFAEGVTIVARLGETQIWTVRNLTKWSHPFHLHGFFFQVLGEDGKPVRPLAWKDTVNVPLESTVRLLVHFDERPGTWMYHCHILDHADGGLMGTVIVGDGADASKRVHTHK
jgi:FtsP/CotA-like multicopper oxidase with cupredoxin domain